MVVEAEGEHESQWATIGSIAEKIGCTTETLRKWVRQAEIDHGRRGGLTSEKRQRMKELERENCELRRANAILREAKATPLQKVFQAEASSCYPRISVWWCGQCRPW